MKKGRTVNAGKDVGTVEFFCYIYVKLLPICFKVMLDLFHLPLLVRTGKIVIDIP